MAVYIPQPGVSLQGAGTDLSRQFLNQQASSTALAFLVHGANLYQLVFWKPVGSLSSQEIGMAKSTDNGATWNVIDQANEPGSTALSSMAGGGTRIDANTLAVVYLVDGPGAILQIQNFDFTTDTWGAIYGTAGSPNLGAQTGTPVTVIYRPASNDLAVLYYGIVGTSGVTLSVYDITGNSWNAGSDPCVNITTLPGYNPAPTFVSNDWVTQFDGTNIYLVFFTQSSDVTWRKRVFFQVINPDNSTPSGSRFFDFPNQVPAPPDINASDQGLFGTPSIVNGNIVIPIGRADLAASSFGGIRYASCYVGVGIPNVSVWNESDITADPAYTVGSPLFLNQLNQMGMSFFDGTNLYIIYVGQFDTLNNTPPWAQIRICTTTPVGNDPNTWIWSALTVTDYTTPPFDQFDWTAIRTIFGQTNINVVNNQVILGTDLFSTTGSGDFFLGNFGSPKPQFIAQIPPFSLPFKMCGPCRKGNLL